LKAIVPGVAFWVVSGLCTALASPADPKGGWVFPVTSGRPTIAQLDAVRLWVTVCATVITCAVVIAFCNAVPDGVSDLKELLAQISIGTALCILLSDVFLLTARTIPFTEARIPLNTDLAWALLRYIIMFPATVIGTMECERWVTRDALHFVASGIVVLLLHSSLRRAHHRAIENQMNRSDIDELTGILPGLGLEQ
jgi:Ca2+/Na+ antiporter